MARTEAVSRFEPLRRFWDALLAARPLVGLAAVLLTTTGSTMNLRELGSAQGWVTAEVYSLQSTFLASLALTILACPYLGQSGAFRGLTQAGLALVAAGSFMNGLLVDAPLSVFLAGRVLAGVGAALVINFAPRLVDHDWHVTTTWMAILLPVAGPGAVAAATMAHGVSDWEWGFLLGGGAVAIGLLLMLSMAEPARFWKRGRPHSTTLVLPPLADLWLEPPPPVHLARSPRHAWPAYLLGLGVAIAGLLYCQHWGQLQGWFESPDVVIASVVGIAGLGVSLLMGWSRLDLVTLKENGIRVVLFFFGGMNQFIHGYTMSFYGGLLVSFSSWQRAWLTWPMPIGIAAVLTFSQLLRWRGQRLALGLPGAAVGLLLLAGGLYLSYWHTMEWPYWQVLDTFDLNWFPAPQHWELAPGRFVMGVGLGLFMVAIDMQVSRDPHREEQLRPFLASAQFLGGSIATGVLINFLLIGHAIHYSYSADRDYVQADELAQRQHVLAAELQSMGVPTPDRAAEAIMFRSVNYEADNLVFASVYATYFVLALVLAGACLVLWAWRRLGGRVRSTAGEPGA